MKFKLKSFLIGFSILTILFAVEVRGTHDTARIVDAIRSEGGSGEYKGRWLFLRDSLSPMLGEDYFRRLSSVSYVGPTQFGGAYCGVGTANPFYYFTSKSDSPASPTDTTLEQLARFDLDALYIARVSLTESNLANIGQLRSLKRLTLSDCDISDRELRQLSAMPLLNTFDLSSNPITDAGITALADYPQLSEFDVCRTHIGNVGLEAIGRNASITNVLAQHTHVTKAGARSLNPMTRPCIIQYGGITPTDEYVEFETFEYR